VPRLYDSPGLIILSHPPGRHISAHSYLTPALRTRQKSRRIPGWLCRLNNAKHYYFFFLSNAYIGTYNTTQHNHRDIYVLRVFKYMYMRIFIYFFFLRQTHRVTDHAILRAPTSGGCGHEHERILMDIVVHDIIYAYTCVVIVIFITPIWRYCDR
jgi:hypothetical protein